VNNGDRESSDPSVSEIVVAKAAEVSSPTLFKEVLAGSNPLLAQFGFANPLAPAPSPACGGITTQLDTDSNDNFLVRVFQSNGAPLPDATVIISVLTTTGSVQLQAVTDVNGLAQFTGPQINITGITLQYSNAGVVSTCVAAGNPNPPSDTSTAPVTAVRNVNYRRAFRLSKEGNWPRHPREARLGETRQISVFLFDGRWIYYRIKLEQISLNIEPFTT
jgi:hypothetical protein